MSQLPKPLSNYIERFNNQYNSLELDDINHESLDTIIIKNPNDLNNLIISGLGASTLILRLGSVILLSRRLEKGKIDEDALFMKQVVENLREVLPSDTNWKNIWNICCEQESEWAKFILKDTNQQSLLDRFITFRNKYVHEKVSVKKHHSIEIHKGIKILSQMCLKANNIYGNTKLKDIDGKYFFIAKNQETNLYPFVEKGEKDGLPYIFQGLYNKSTPELISTFYGDIEQQKENMNFNKLFDSMRNHLKGGAGKVFDHRSRIEYYNDCFVGRDKESSEILDWSLSDNVKNILPIFSHPGMGKGALITDVISKLSDANVPVLYHFCGSGLANNLHAIIYHFILQGKKMQLWTTDDEDLKNKISRLPSKYSDAIMLLHSLLDKCFVPTRKNTMGNLVIIIDGLDEAYVSHSEYNIKDYFNTYDDNGEVVDNWNSKTNIKWIFTYRQGFYQFPDFETIQEINSVQPLMGLSAESVQTALSEFNPSQEFNEAVINKGSIINVNHAVEN